MANFLLWNVQRTPQAGLLTRLAAAHALDGLLLVEHANPDGAVRAALAGAGLEPVACDPRFGVFVRPPLKAGRLAVDGLARRVDFFRVGVAGRDGLLGLVHGYDRRNYDDASRSILFARLAEQVRLFEEEAGHRRTVLAGDFNSNPFEPAVVGVQGLHALGVRTVRGRPYRRVKQRDTDFFYNPMWRLYGHGADAATATHYYCGGGAVEHVWHMLDQVIVRPELADAVPDANIRVLTSIGETPLLTPAGPLTDVSDHLPVLFRWDV